MTTSKPVRRRSFGAAAGRDQSLLHALLARRPSARACIANLQSVASSDDHDDDNVIHQICQSELAHNVPDFPDDLLGGSHASACRKLRSMFGYAMSGLNFESFSSADTKEKE